MVHRCCQVCGRTAGLEACTRCSVVLFCPQHLARGMRLGSHANQCRAVRRAKQAIEEAETRLRRDSADRLGGPYSLPPGIFEDYTGQFWAILETKPYISARANLTKVLIQIGSWNSLDQCVSECKDILQLCGIGPLGNFFIHDRLLALLVRLGREQECYEITKEWIRNSIAGECQDISALDDNIRPSADILENPVEALRLYEAEFELPMLASALLVKVSLLINLQEIQQVSCIPGYINMHIPAEILDMIRTYVASPTVLGHAGIMSEVYSGGDLESLAGLVNEQMISIVAAMSRAENGWYFWDLFSTIDSAYDTEEPDDLQGGVVPVGGGHVFETHRLFFEDNPQAIRAVDSALKVCSMEEECYDYDDDDDDDDDDDEDETGDSE